MTEGTCLLILNGRREGILAFLFGLAGTGFATSGRPTGEAFANIGREK